MIKREKRISVPSILIDNRDISPKATFLYIMLREIASYDNGAVEIYREKLMKRLNWIDRRTLKKYLAILKDNSLIDYDFSELPKYKPICVIMHKQKKNFEFIGINTLHRLVEVTEIDREMLIRIYLLFRQYTQTEYNYCWLSYKDILEKVPLSYSTIAIMSRKLEELKIIKIEKGIVKRNSDDIYYKERNKYLVISN